MKEFLLVLLGAIISCGTTWFLDFLRYRREEKIYYKRKKEETYLSICSIIYKLTGSEGHYIKDSNWEAFYDQIMDLTVSLEIYASRKVYTFFAKKIIKELSLKNNYNVSDETLTSFINLIKEDLKLEGN